MPAGAATGAAAAPAEVAQEPTDQPIDQPTDPQFPDETEVTWPDEEEEEEGGAEAAGADTLAPALPVKPTPAASDSTRSGEGARFAPDSTGARGGTMLPVGGGAPAETLGYKPSGVGVGGTKTASVKPKERGPFLGIHPAAFFLLLAAGHIFIVRTVAD